MCHVISISSIRMFWFSRKNLQPMKMWTCLHYVCQERVSFRSVLKKKIILRKKFARNEKWKHYIGRITSLSTNAVSSFCSLYATFFASGKPPPLTCGHAYIMISTYGKSGTKRKKKTSHWLKVTFTSLSTNVISSFYPSCDVFYASENPALLVLILSES